MHFLFSATAKFRLSPDTGRVTRQTDFYWYWLDFVSPLLLSPPIMCLVLTSYYNNSQRYLAFLYIPTFYAKELG